MDSVYSYSVAIKHMIGEFFSYASLKAFEINPISELFFIVKYFIPHAWIMGSVYFAAESVKFLLSFQPQYPTKMTIGILRSTHIPLIESPDSNIPVF